MSININPAHKGMLHKDLGVSQDKKLTYSDLLTASHSKDPAERKRAVFALNARRWNKGKPKKQNA